MVNSLRLARRRSTRTVAFDIPPATIIKRRSHSVSDAETLSHMSDLIEISIEVRELCSASTGEETLQCAVYQNDDGDEDSWRIIGCSKPVTRFANVISFHERFPLKYVFEKTQYVKVDICGYSGGHHSSSSLSDNIIGCCIFKLDELTGSFGLQLRKTLHREFSLSTASAPHRSLPCPVGGLLVTGVTPDKEQPIVIQFSGKSLEKKELFWDESAVFFRVFRIEDNYNEDEESRVLLYESEAIQNHSHPQWKAFSLPTKEVADDRNRLLEVWVCYRDVDNTEGIIGKFLTTYAKMKYGAGPDNVYNVVNENRKLHKKNYEHSGRVELTKFTDVSFYSFLDYIVSGTQLHFEVAVDFANHQKLSDFELGKFDEDVHMVVRALGEIIRDYSPNRLFPAFGMGAKVPPTFHESHEFCLNFSADPMCRGLDGVLEAYRKAVSCVRPIDHVAYSPVINFVTNMARQHASGLHYHILVILTKGGAIHDYKDTLAALIDAADAPLSIIFIGIGNGDFSHVQKLANKRKHSPRDTVEFICLNDVIDPVGNVSDNRARISQKSLHPVPQQMLQYMHQKGIAAKPPIQACRSPLFHSSFLIPDRPSEFHMDEIPSRAMHLNFDGLLTDRRGSDSHCFDHDRYRDHLSVKLPERSHSVLQTTRERYQRKLTTQHSRAQLPLHALRRLSVQPNPNE